MVMKMIELDDEQCGSQCFKELAGVLKNDGIICFPAESNYRLGASALSPKAVNTLVAAKRRSRHAPALIFVSGPEMLDSIAASVPPIGLKLAQTFWPGPLTLLIEPGDIFPKKVRKTLTKATGLIGVRVPGHPVARGIVERFGKPILVSSANLAKRAGATSPAQVRKNFGRQVEAMVDLGDLPPAVPSTLVGILGASIEIRRQGAVSEEKIRAAAGLS